MKHQRIKKHIEAQNWFAVLLELLIVFLAVFVGLQADNWNDARVAKSNAKTYYLRLIDDLRAEESTRLARITYYQQTLEHGESALQALTLPRSVLDEKFLIDLYQVTQIWNYTPQRATYDELLSMGIANAIPDIGVRSRLANYYLGLENSKLIQQERTPFRRNLRRHMPHSVQRAVREHCGDMFESGSDGIVIVSLPLECDLSFEPKQISEAVTAVFLYEELEIDLTHGVGDLDNKLLNLGNYIAPTREIITHLTELAK